MPSTRSNTTKKVNKSPNISIRRSSKQYDRKEADERYAKQANDNGSLADFEEELARGKVKEDSSSFPLDYDDDYKPSRFNLEDLPWRSRGRGRGRGRSQGRGQDRKSFHGGKGDQAMKKPKSSTEISTLSGASHISRQDIMEDANNDNRDRNGNASSGDSAEIHVESIEETEKRLSVGSIKHNILTLLKEAGKSGMSVQELVSTIQMRGLRQWSEPRQGRNSVSSTCGSDPAFIRIAPATFALRVLFSQEELRKFSASASSIAHHTIKSPGTPALRSLANMESQKQDLLGKIQGYEQGACHEGKNNFKCSKCHRGVALDCSPLLLCDTCPRSYHMNCLNLGFESLPNGVWLCPKCLEKLSILRKKIDDLENRKVKMLEQVARKEQAAHERKRLAAIKINKKISDPRLGDAISSISRIIASSEYLGTHGRSLQKPLEDLEVIEEEMRIVAELELQLRRLQSISQEDQEKNSLDEKKIRHIESQLEKGFAAVEKFNRIIKGPPDLEPVPCQDMSMNHLREACAVSEFLYLYGDCCELPKIFNTYELLEAIVWPLEHADELGSLYRQLLLCCLLELLNWGSPIKGKASRWYRVLADSTWPEILRRYLLLTLKAKKHVAEDQALENTGDRKEDFSNTKCSIQLDSGHENVSETSMEKTENIFYCRYDGIKISDSQTFSVDDKSFVLNCASFLETGGWWELPSGAHLRLLARLCDDIANGTTLRADISNRINEYQDINQLYAKKRFELKRKRRTSSTDDQQHQSEEKKPKHNGLDDAMTSENGNSVGIQNACLATEANEEEMKFTKLFGKSWKYEFIPSIENRMEEISFRTDPLGEDRYKRQYWWLRGTPGCIFVESPNGDFCGIISSVPLLDSFISSLCIQGTNESKLRLNLSRFYGQIKLSFDSAKVLDVGSIARPTGLPSDSDLLDTLNNKMLDATKERLNAFLEETQSTGIVLGAEFKYLNQKLSSCETARQLCTFLLELESCYCAAGEGLPDNSTNFDMIPYLGQEDAIEIPNICFPTIGIPDDDNSSHQELQTVNENERSGQAKESIADDGRLDKVISGHPEEETESSIQMVSVDDDLDDSDAEYQYLREKRLRRPARLWRSGRERAAWLKAVIHVRRHSKSNASMYQICYISFMLADRAGSMLVRIQRRNENEARWEEAEKRAEEELAAKRARGELEDGQKGNKESNDPNYRPLMIRTGKTRTETGMKLTLKAMGRNPFPSIRTAGAEELAAVAAEAEAQVKLCRWGYHCSICLMAGDLLCCEHEDGCNVSIHPGCSGQDFPHGPWICANHDDLDLKSRVRRRGASIKDVANYDNDGLSEDFFSDTDLSEEDNNSDATVNSN